MDRACRGLIDIGEIFVLGDHVGERASVGADDSIEAPFVHGYVFEDGLGCHGDSVVRVVGGHVRARTAFHHAHAEGHRVALAQQALIKIGR